MTFSLSNKKGGEGFVYENLYRIFSIRFLMAALNPLQSLQNYQVRQQQGAIWIIPPSPFDLLLHCLWLYIIRITASPLTS